MKQRKPAEHRGITAADLPGRPGEEGLNFALFKRNKFPLPPSCKGLCGEELKAELVKLRERQSRNSKNKRNDA